MLVLKHKGVRQELRMPGKNFTNTTIRQMTTKHAISRSANSPTKEQPRQSKDPQQHVQHDAIQKNTTCFLLSKQVFNLNQVINWQTLRLIISNSRLCQLVW